MQLSEILNVHDLANELGEGYVTRQYHPSLPLAILNYTADAMFDYHWNDTTKQCRGLIYNLETEEVVARPFDKFFNYGDYGDGWIEDYRMSPCVVTDKLDGSLGILYPTPNGLAVATRGSFTSDQAVHATKLVRQRYFDWAIDWEVNEGKVFTHLVEIIYPNNRVVVDYGDFDDLVYLGARHIEYGFTVPPTGVQWGIPFPLAQIMPYHTFNEAFAAEHRSGKEGLVVHFTDKDVRVKLKQPDYIEIAKIVFNMNERTVFKAMFDPATWVPGKGIEYLKKGMPEEFWPWIDEVVTRYQKTFEDMWMQAIVNAKKVESECVDPTNKKEFADKANGYGNFDFMMKAWGQEWDRLERSIWKFIWHNSVDGRNHLKVINWEEA